MPADQPSTNIQTKEPSIPEYEGHPPPLDSPVSRPTKQLIDYNQYCLYVYFSYTLLDHERGQVFIIWKISF